MSEYIDHCFKSLVDRMRYLAQVAKHDVMRNALNDGADRIDELERSWISVDDYIWCEHHGCFHEKTIDPYQYGYEDSGEEPECNEVDWRKISIEQSLPEPPND